MSRDWPNASNVSGEVITSEVEWWKVGMCVAYSVAFTVGLLGNILVVLAVLRYTHMRTVTNVYIVNLALTDLSYISGLPVLVTTMIMGSYVTLHCQCLTVYYYVMELSAV
jgi:hypothetical protein